MIADHPLYAVNAAATLSLSDDGEPIGWAEVSKKGRLPQSKPDVSRHPVKQDDPFLRAQLRDLLEGRSYLFVEMVAAWAFSHHGKPALVAPVVRWNLLIALEALAEQGEVERVAAVGLRPLHCRRCGAREGFVSRRCSLCGRREVICNDCAALGRASSCVPLYRKAASRTRQQGRMLHLPHPLTPLQEESAAMAARHLDGGKGPFLIEAVCGAGKTSMGLAALAPSLAAGARVLWTTPRRSVVDALAPQMQAALGSDVVAIFHGARHDPENKGALLTLATAAQAVRFYQAFDRLVWDESDAFPMPDPFLYRAVEGALRPQSPSLYLSATPHPTLLRQTIRTGDHCLVPARPHGRPLPEPTFWHTHDLLQAEADLLRRVLYGKQRWLFFYPTVAAVTEAYRRACLCHPKERGRFACFHAGHVRPKEREWQIAFCTTYLERGITLPDVQVAVFAADRPPFDAPTLVQIAGRVGRAPAAPSGEVLLIAPSASHAMKQARDTIRRMNAAARRRGWLHDG
ncbi:MAG: hypothetical protein IMW91_05200 [Firmicutes bacterium]|nr:hypothetical protein [Bacillota bacterium]